MTKELYAQVVGWWSEGKLDYRENNSAQWSSWTPHRPPSYIPHDVAEYRERPEKPPMPDEVWLSDNQKPEDDGAGDTYTAHTMMCGAYKWHGGNLVRYVRADATALTLDNCQCRAKSHKSYAWRDCSEYEFRVKPPVGPAMAIPGAGGGQAI